MTHTSTPGHDPHSGHDETSQAHASANPYYSARRPEAPAPDLDTGSPVLTAAETHRLNRKALLFLAGIVVLIFLLGFFVLKGSKEQPKTAAVQADKPMVVPALPSALEESAPPIALQPSPEPVELPPLPDLPPSYAQQQPLELRNDGESHGSSLMGRRMGSAGGAPGSSPGGSAMGGGEDRAMRDMQAQQMQLMQNAMLGLQPGGVPAPTVAMPPTSAQFMSNPNALLVRGTYLRCVLETRIVTDLSGYTSCILTEPVYSVNGRGLLLPKGSKILGQYAPQSEGVDRVAVVWDRVITPNGIDVSMSNPGVDGLGGAGHPGRYNAHWGSRIASALLISLISDGFQWAAAKHGPQSSTVYAGPGGSSIVSQPFQSATARSMERLANDALQKSAQRPPTVTINQGAIVNVYVAQDVDFTGVMALR